MKQKELWQQDGSSWELDSLMRATLPILANLLLDPPTVGTPPTPRPRWSSQQQTTR